MLIYERLYNNFGSRGWWPGDTPFEIIVGAILTQNTSWENVEKAIAQLKIYNLLDLEGMYKVEESLLAKAIRSSGFYNIKATRLKNFLVFLIDEYKGNLDVMFSEDLENIRYKLLGVNGIGPETADSILLYAGCKPVFVVDAYTKRIFSRHNFISEKNTYNEIQELFMKNIPEDVDLYNEYHALIVNLGKKYCKKKPNCTDCPLSSLAFFFDSHQGLFENIPFHSISGADENLNPQNN